MSVRIAERRTSLRAAAAYPITLRDRQRVLARGRTANISESGVFMIARFCNARDQQNIIAEITLPATAAVAHASTRTVRYICRVTRQQPIGQLIGLGIELLRKLT